MNHYLASNIIFSDETHNLLMMILILFESLLKDDLH